MTSTIEKKLAGYLPVEVVKAANKAPFNLKEGNSKPYNLHFAGTEATIEIGSNSFTCKDNGYGTAMVPVSVDGTPLIGLILADGHLLLNLVVFDECNAPVLHIKNNQLIYSTSPWDIQLVGKKLTIREAHKKILFEVEFFPPNRVVINRGRLLRNGVEILIRPSNILVTNNSTLLRDCHAHNCYGGLIIGYHENPVGGFMALQSVPRYLGDRTEALKFEKESLQRIESYS